MQLKVKQLHGVECDVEVDENMSVKDFYAIVFEKLKSTIESKKMTLIFKGRPLFQENLLKDYNISDGDRVNLVLKNSVENGESIESARVRFDKYFKEHLRKNYFESDIEKIVACFHQILVEKVKAMNYDELERLATAWIQHRNEVNHNS